MVSLITRHEYIKQVEHDEYSIALVAFLWEQEINKSIATTSNNANDISKNAFFALHTNDPIFFSKVYEEISRRKPNQDSEWVFNDVLLFAIVLGVYKFKTSRDWIDSVLAIRLKHSQSDSGLVTQTFLDILGGNLVNKNNHQPLTLVMKYILNLPLGEADHINSIYQELIQRAFPYSKTSFLNLISLKALDVVLLSKGLINLERQKAIEEFLDRFNEKITFFATLLWWALISIIVLVSIKFFIYFFTATTEQVEIINRIITSLSIVGIGGGLIVPVIVYKNKIIDFFKKPFFKYYNYKQEKIQ